MEVGEYRAAELCQVLRRKRRPTQPKKGKGVSKKLAALISKVSHIVLIEQKEEDGTCYNDGPEG